MQTIIVSSSRSPHRNTRRIADAIADVLDARVIAPTEATPDVLTRADRIGFGSGIYWMNFDAALRECIRALPDMSGREAFVFATSGLPEPPLLGYTRRFGTLLEQKGLHVVGTFTSRGLDTWGPFGIAGGVNKTRPNDADIARARRFAATLT